MANHTVVVDPGHEGTGSIGRFGWQLCQRDAFSFFSKES